MVRLIIKAQISEYSTSLYYLALVAELNGADNQVDDTSVFSQQDKIFGETNHLPVTCHWLHYVIDVNPFFNYMRTWKAAVSEL